MTCSCNCVQSVGLLTDTQSKSLPYASRIFDQSAVADPEKAQLSRLAEFATTGNAYTKEHGTKGATIGLVLSTSTLALLAYMSQ